MGINYYEENIYNLFSTAPIQSVYSKKIVHRPDHLLPGYESAVNFFWHRRCITIPNNTALIVDICGQHGMKKRFIYVHYAFIDGITKLQNKSCYFKLETQLVLFQNIGAAFIVKLFRPTLWRWRYYPVLFLADIHYSGFCDHFVKPQTKRLRFLLRILSLSLVCHSGRWCYREKL